jgi:hypothetical protein
LTLCGRDGRKGCPVNYKGFLLALTFGLKGKEVLSCQTKTTSFSSAYLSLGVEKDKVAEDKEVLLLHD